MESAKENDAEHSWHLALMCGILAEYSNEPIDVLKTMKMVLLHDAIEIDAGDTYAYDAAGNQTKKRAGAKRRQTGYFRYSRKIWRKSTGTFGKNLKRAKPRRQNLPMCLTMHSQCFLNDASEGKSWREHGVKKSQIMKRNARTHEGSEAIWEYQKEIIEQNIKKAIS